MKLLDDDWEILAMSDGLHAGAVIRLEAVAPLSILLRRQPERRAA